MKRLAKFLKLSPFSSGFLMVLAACLLLVSFGEHKPEILSVLDSRAMDYMFRARGTLPTHDSVVVVDIDEKSLRTLGQWPWPRDVVAKLVESIGDAGAKVIGFDIVFPETDRSSPHRVLSYINEKAPALFRQDPSTLIEQTSSLNNDLLLGATVAKYPTVLGYAFLTKNDGLKRPEQVPFPSISLRTLPESTSFGKLRLFSAYRPLLNIPEVSQSVSEGFFNFFPDPSGMVRKVPLFIEMDGIPYPSLALEMYRIAAGVNEAVLHASILEQDGKRGVLGVNVGDKFLTTDDFGQIAVNYRGPVGTFPYISAVDVIEGLHIDTIKGRYVLLGTSAAGLHDLRSTPFSAVCPGVEIHATLIDNFLTGDILEHDLMLERGITFALIIVGGLFLSALLTYASPLTGGICGVGLLVLSMVGNYYFFFLNNIVVGLTYPILVIFGIFLTVTIFNYFFVGREKRFIDMAFSRYISPQVALQLKRDPSQLTLSGTEKELTILFSDIRGFTSISEQMSANQLGAFMNRYLTAMSKEVLSRQGTVDKFIGDAIMAIWGAPLDNPFHAQNAVQAALAMVTRLKHIQDEWQKENLPRIKVGIGINTGLASVGNFGSEERFDYTVIGDSVNLASRLEGLTKLYAVPIIISESTRTVIGDQFFCRRLDRVRVKGKEKPVTIYEPLLEGVPNRDLQEEIENFEKALDFYFEQNFEKTAAIFDQLREQSPSLLYDYYANRVKKLIEQPPGDGWDGVTVHARK